MVIAEDQSALHDAAVRVQRSGARSRRAGAAPRRGAEQLMRTALAAVAVAVPIAVSLAGCGEPELRDCGAVRCGPEQRCIEADRCAGEEAIAACAAIEDGERCTTDSVDVGRCASYGELLVCEAAVARPCILDEFGAAALDPRWTYGTQDGEPAVPMVPEAGALHVRLPGVAAYSFLYLPNLDFREASAQLEVASLRSGPHTQLSLEVLLDADNVHVISANAGFFRAASTVGGVERSTQRPTFDPILDRHWRIVHSYAEPERISLETSADGEAWVVALAVGTVGSYASARVQIQAGAPMATPDPGDAFVDNFRVDASRCPPSP